MCHFVLRLAIYFVISDFVALRSHTRSILLLGDRSWHVVEANLSGHSTVRVRVNDVFLVET